MPILERLVDDGLRHQPGVAAARRPDRADRPPAARRAASGRSRSRPRPGSDRLRRVINKTVTNERDPRSRRSHLPDRHREPEALLHDRPPDRDRRGPRRDSRSDARRSASACSSTREPRGTIGRIVASVNPLVPKPGTTYQWMPMTDADVIEREDRAPARPRRPTSTTSTSTSSPSGIRTTRACCRSATAASPTSSSSPKRNGGNWRAAVADAGLDADAYLYRDRSGDAFLPWQIIDGGIKTALLPPGAREERPRRMDAAAPKRQAGQTPRSCPAAI